MRTSSGAITARADASPSLPTRVRKTIWSASPAWAGKRLWSRSVARCESVFGSEKLFASRLPTACETASTPTASTTQATTTIRRWAIVQRVNLSISELLRISGRGLRLDRHDGHAGARSRRPFGRTPQGSLRLGYARVPVPFAGARTTCLDVYGDPAYARGRANRSGGGGGLRSRRCFTA